MAKKLRGLLFVFLGFLGVFALVGCTPASTNSPVQESTPTAEACQFLPPAEPDYTPTHDPPTSTIKLIDTAWLAGEITLGERLIYLAYGFFEPASLPARFIGARLVSGTSVAVEINQAVQDPAIMCQFSSCEQEELKRLLGYGIDCANNP